METPHSIDKDNMWGRTHNTNWGHTLQVFALMMTSMIGTTYVWTACTNFQCEALGPANNFLEATNKVTAILGMMPQFSMKATIVYIGWLIFQGVLYAVLPT